MVLSLSSYTLAFLVVAALIIFFQVRRSKQPIFGCEPDSQYKLTDREKTATVVSNLVSIFFLCVFCVIDISVDWADQAVRLHYFFLAPLVVLSAIFNTRSYVYSIFAASFVSVPSIIYKEKGTFTGIPMVVCCFSSLCGFFAYKFSADGVQKFFSLDTFFPTHRTQVTHIPQQSENGSA